METNCSSSSPSSSSPKPSSSHVFKVSPQYIERLKLYYTTIISHAITDDGRLLLAPIKNKQLAIFPLEYYLKELHDEFVEQNESSFEDSRGPFDGSTGRLKPISLIPVENSLTLCLDGITDDDDSQLKFILGGQGSIKGYKIPIEANIIQECKEEWTIKLSSDKTLANAIVQMKSSTSRYLAVGSSDNKIFLFDYETQKQQSVLTGHSDYLHSLKCVDSDRYALYSASEDGSVQRWDIRTPQKSIFQIYPFQDEKLARPQFGKWISGLDVSKNDQWLVCGGGPSLSLWHLSSRKCSNIIDTSGVIHTANFSPTDQSSVISAGDNRAVTVWQGSLGLSKIESSIENIYSIFHHRYEDFDYDLFSFAGDSYQIEICKNIRFIDFKLFVA